MAAYIDDFITAVRAQVLASWPDVAAEGVYEAEDIERIPFEDLTPPYAVLVMSDLTDAEDGGTANHAYNCDVEAWYFGATVNPATIRAKLETLRDEMEDAELATGQVIDIGALSWSAALAPNVTFLAKNLPALGGRVVARMMVGEV